MFVLVPVKLCLGPVDLAVYWCKSKAAVAEGSWGRLKGIVTQQWKSVLSKMLTDSRDQSSNTTTGMDLLGQSWARNYLCICIDGNTQRPHSLPTL